MEQVLVYRGCEVTVRADATENGRISVSYQTAPVSEYARAAYNRNNLRGVRTLHEIEPHRGELAEDKALAFGIASAKGEIDLMLNRNW